MKFASEKFLPSAIYNIVNTEHGCSIAFGDEDDNNLVASQTDDFEWKVIQLSAKKWIIESNADGGTAGLPPDMEEGDDVGIHAAGRDPQLWVVKRRSVPDPQDCYIIYCPKESDLFWNLPNGAEGTTVQFARGSKNRANWWKFNKLRDIDTTITGQGVADPAAARPTHQSPVVGNSIKISVPPEWFATISAVSLGDCINFVRVNRMVKGVLETQSFQSTWDNKGQAMTVTDSGMKSHAIPAEDTTSSLALYFFHSTNQRRRDPLVLPEKNDVSTKLRVISVERPDDMRTVADGQTFWIFDENENDGRQNAIVVIQLTKKQINLTDPEKPAPGTVNEGYDDNLDRPRPNNMDEYLGNYNIIFIVDDSGSMAGSRWREVRQALAEVANEAMQYDADGVEICFLNSPRRENYVSTRDAVLRIFDEVRPTGRTPTGAKLLQILGEITQTLDDAVDTPAYFKIKPFDVIVLTDGVSTDDPLPVLEAAAEQLDEGLHHPNAVGIQFLQIGKDDGAEDALKALASGNVRNMVDRVPYAKHFSPERIQRVLLGGIHPSIRAKMQG